MEIVPIVATCLSPLQYHTVQAARGTKTAPFIGDLAIDYALCQSEGVFDNSRMQNEKAEYSELQKSPYLASVFRPIEDEFNYLPALSRNTLVAIETLGTNEDPTTRTGSSMYSNFYFTQPIAMGSKFKGYIMKEESATIPETIRVGNQRQCLLKLSTEQDEELGLTWINLYTLQHVVGKEDITLEDNMEIYEALHQYRIVKNVPKESMEKWCEPFWRDK